MLRLQMISDKNPNRKRAEIHLGRIYNKSCPTLEFRTEMKMGEGKHMPPIAYLFKYSAFDIWLSLTGWLVVEKCMLR